MSAYSSGSEPSGASNDTSDTNEQTILQTIIIEKTAFHFLSRPEECNLIKEMLSFQHWKRPSCDDIIDRISRVTKKVTHSQPEEALEEVFIPAPVVSLGMLFIIMFIC